MQHYSSQKEKNVKVRSLAPITRTFILRPAPYRAVLAFLALLGGAGTALADPPTVAFSSPSQSIFTRPGGSSFTWTYTNGTTPADGSINQYPVTAISYHNVTAFNWILTRGTFQYASSTAGPWTTYSVTTNPNYISVSGRVFRFVDSLPSDSTTTNNIGIGWQLGGGAPSGNVGSGTGIIPDNAPTDITSNFSVVPDDAALSSTLATLTPTDTGMTTGGRWAITSQSVANLFTLQYDNTKGNTATLLKGSGTMPAIGQTATVTVRYNDWFQTDSSNVAISGQGFTKTLTFTVIGDATNSLTTFGHDAAANTYTTSFQTYPAAATLSTGNYVVVWQSSGQNKASTDQSGIYGQIFTSAGAKVGSEFLIASTSTTTNEIAPAVTALNSGRFTVAYSRATDTSSAPDIAFRIVEANGTVGSEIIANATTAGYQYNPAIATLSDGSFVIVWTSDNGDVRLRQFAAANGAASGAEVVIVTGVASPVAGGYYPSVTALTGGGYALAWIDSADSTVKTKTSTGSIVSTGIASSGYGPPRVGGLAGGGYVLASDSYDSGADKSSIVAARYNNSGALQGGIFQVNTLTSGNRYEAALTPLSGGGFLVAWSSEKDDLLYGGIFGRRFGATGTAIDAADFQINEYRLNDQQFPAATALANDGFATSWSEQPDTSTYLNAEVKTRVFTPVTISAPTVTTPTSTSVAATTATLGGNVTSDGGSAVTTRGVVISATATNSNPQIGGIGVTVFATTGTTGVFTVNATGLTAGTSYSFTAYATNSAGTSYTNPAGTFTTAAPASAVTNAILTTSGNYGSTFTTYTITGSNTPTSYTATGLPGGLSVNSSNGQITGTPTASGTFNVTIGAANATGGNTATLVITIAKVNLTITGLSASSRDYTGTTTALLTGTPALSGVVSGDEANVSLSGTASGTFAGANVGNGQSVTVSGLSLTGSASANYTLTLPSLTANITAVQLTVTADDKSRVYSKANPPLTATITGFVNSETLGILSGAPALATAADASSLPNTYNITAAIGSLSATNYTFTFVNGTLTVTPLTYPDWAADQFTAGEMLDSAISGPDADPEFDGIPNLLEYALDLDPWVADRAGLPDVSLATDSGDRYLALAYTHSKVAGDLTYTVEVSSDLVTWSTISGVSLGVTDHGATELVSVRDTLAVTGYNKRFVRLLVAGASTTGRTVPAGFVALTALGTNTDTRLSEPLARADAFVGRIASVSASTLTVHGSPGWSADQFVKALPGQPDTYYAQITSGSAAGSYFTVTANTADTVTLDFNGGSPALSAGDSFSIIPFWTLGTLYPAGDAGTSFAVSTGALVHTTELLFLDHAYVGTSLPIASTYYHFNGAWRKFGQPTTTSFDDLAVPPDEFFIQRNKTPATTTKLVILGHVVPGALTTPINAQAGATKQDNAVALRYAGDVTLAGSNLIASGAFVASTSSVLHKDELLVYDNSVTGLNKSPSAVYYYYNGAWRKFAQPVTSNFGSDPVFKAGNGVVIRKAGAGTSSTSTNWTFSTPGF
ncbi:MAG: TIGR02597 family protein [Luteolibacter sp.]